MTRAPCGVDENGDGLKKGPWTPEEDRKLVAYVQKHGHGSWRLLPLNAGLQRCGKSCRLRWTNYLRPDIKRGRFSQDEEQMIVHLHAILGNRWSAIASHLPRRTDNEIKNYWNTHLKKRLVQMGIDPVTHKSTEAEQLVLDSIIPGLRPLVSSNLTHMSQWDSFRAEAEARLSGQSPSSELLPEPPNQVATSTTFMSSWKAQIAETLRPSFGEVELDKPTPVNFQTFLQDWESSLQGRISPTIFSTYGSPIQVPDLSSETPSGAVSPQYDIPHAQVCLPMFPTSAGITERLLQCREFDTSFALETESQSSSFRFAAMCSTGGDSESNEFSPTSTLHDHDSSGSYTDSPCIGNVDAQVHGELVFPQDSFWSRQQVTMADAGWSFNGVNPIVDMANGILIPQFQDSLM